MKKFVTILVMVVILLFSMSMVSADGNFVELQSNIDASTDEYNLTTDYKYDGVGSADGIIIDKPNFVLDGKNHTIDGNNQAKIFNITGDNVTIKNLNLINGNSTSYGGAIYAYFGSILTIYDSTFTNNNAYQGGAIFSEVSLYIYNSTFINNHADWGGGAIRAMHNISVFDSTFISNSANLSGGAIEAYENIDIFDSIFISNSAYTYVGGAVCADNMSVYDSIFINNYAKNYGGALYSYNNLNISNSNFTGHFAWGGGAVSAGVLLRVNNSVFINNSADMGGAIWTENNISIINSTFINNHAIEHNGGAIIAYTGYLYIVNSSFINNSAASSGGAISTGFNATVYIISSIFINNFAVVYGGAIVAAEGLVVYNSIFNYNSAEYGGAISSYDLNVTFSEFSNNNAVKGSSMAITVNNISFINNDTYIRYNNIFDSKPVYNFVDSNFIDLNHNYFGSNNPKPPLLGNSENANFSYYFTMRIESYDYLNKNVGEAFGINYIFTDNSNELNIPGPINKIYDITFLYNGKLIKDMYGNMVENRNGAYNHSFGIYITDLLSNISVIYENKTMCSLLFNSSKGGVNFEISPIRNVSYMDTVEISIKLTNQIWVDLANEFLNITIDGKDYSDTTDENGNIKINYLANKIGSIDLKVIFNGNPLFNASSENVNFLVIKSKNCDIKVENISMFYKDGTRLVAYLIDNLGNPLENITVTFHINGGFYDCKTNSTGHASMALNLNPGIYNVKTEYKESNTNEALENIGNVIIKPTIMGNDIVKLYKNGTQYYVTVLDNKGNPLVNKSIEMNINGKFYSRNTNDKGIAMLTINLNPGSYVITVKNPIDNLTMSNNITVLPTIIGNNLTKYYLNASQFHVKIIDGEGKAIVNTNVTMNINGVFYTKTTNNEGIATLTIKLNPAKYILTVKHPFDDLEMSYTIIVLPTLIGKNITMFSNDRKPYEVTLLDGMGKPLSGKTITININGIFYEKDTDSNGIARLNINLDPDTYIATAMYDGYQTSNSVVINNGGSISPNNPNGGSTGHSTHDDIKKIAENAISDQEAYIGTPSLIGDKWYVPIHDVNGTLIDRIVIDAITGFVSRG